MTYSQESLAIFNANMELQASGVMCASYHPEDCTVCECRKTIPTITEIEKAELEVGELICEICFYNGGD